MFCTNKRRILPWKCLIVCIFAEEYRLVHNGPYSLDRKPYYSAQYRKYTPVSSHSCEHHLGVDSYSSSAPQHAVMSFELGKLSFSWLATGGLSCLIKFAKHEQLRYGTLRIHIFSMFTSTKYFSVAVQRTVCKLCFVQWMWIKVCSMYVR